MITLGLSLSSRRKEMAAQLKKHPTAQSAADFDYRRRITDDIEAILRDGDVFKSSLGDPHGQYEQNALLRRLAEDIVRYIIR